MERIACAGWELDLLPAIGGAIAALRHDGRDILRPAEAGTTDPLRTACFPLVPYANRIAHGRFAFGGETRQLPLNFGDHPHSLHGIGWQRPWRIDERDAATALLSLVHDGGAGWPWRVTSSQRFVLGARGLEATLTVTNLDDRTMAAGLGFHPYFPIDATARLTFRAECMWQADATMLPTVPVPPAAHADWARGAPVRPFLDNAFEGWDGSATLDDVTIAAQGARWLHVFIPEGEAYCCIEPVSHGPDAVNRGGMPMLEPGGTASLTMRITVGG